MRLGHSLSFPQGRAGMWTPEPRILSFSQAQHSIPYQVQQECAGCFSLGSKLGPLSVDVHDDMGSKAAADRCPGEEVTTSQERSVHTTSGASAASDFVPVTDPPGTPAPPAGHAGHR